MTDEWRRTAEELVQQRDEWRRIANERAAHMVSMNQRLRKIVLMLAQRKRQARRDVLRARALGDHKAAPLLVVRKMSAYCEASDAHELARRILRGTAA